MTVEFLAPLVTVISGSLLFVLLMWERRTARQLRQTSAGPGAAARQSVLARLSTLLVGAARRDVFELSMGATVALGFDAASVFDRLEDTPIITFGNWRCVAPTHAIRATGSIFEANATEVVVTSWRSDAHKEIYSVSTIEPVTSLVMVGWSRLPVSNELADDFARVVQLMSGSLTPDPLRAEPSWAG